MPSSAIPCARWNCRRRWPSAPKCCAALRWPWIAPPRPRNWWPSWSYHVAEAALAAGAPEIAAALAGAVVDRVYRQLDRRSRDDGLPLPGVAPEFWPEPAPDGTLLWEPGEAYGWGANSV